MIYCERVENYVEQDEKCINCIFYETEKDDCTYELFYPGLKKEKDESNN
jgi:hypothetical protein